MDVAGIHRRRGVLLVEQASPCPNGQTVKLASRPGVPHTAPLGDMVHDAFLSFPPTPPPKKKGWLKPDIDNILGTIMSRLLQLIIIDFSVYLRVDPEGRIPWDKS